MKGLFENVYYIIITTSSILLRQSFYSQLYSASACYFRFTVAKRFVLSPFLHIFVIYDRY